MNTLKLIYNQVQSKIIINIQFMGKQFRDNQGGRGARGGGSRGAPRGGGRGNFRGGNNRFPEGPPSYVIAYGTFVHRSENTFVVKCTELTRFPKFNRPVYLESKAKVGVVDEIFGPVKDFYFSVKPAEGVNPASFKTSQVFYMNPEDLLQVDRITKAGSRGGPKGPPKGNFGGNKFGKPQQGGKNFKSYPNKGGFQKR